MKLSIQISTIFLLMLCFATGFSQTSKQDTLKMLMRKVDILTEELEKSKLGEVAKREYKSKYGLGPAASMVYHKESGVSIAGYGEVVYENYKAEKDDGSASGALDKIDYVRNIIYVGYKYSENLLFNAEIEFEHALAGEGKPGEVAMEFGYIDATIVPEFTVRAGMVLVPVGIMNEYHEPSTFFGSLRPETEKNIIPSTWRANGLGFVGATSSGIGYRVYLVEGLRADKFTSTGVRGGRQKGAKAIAEDLGIAGRIDYTGVPGLNIGASFFNGNSGQGISDDAGNEINVGTTIFSAHGMFNRKGLELRALYAKSSISDVTELNNALGLTGASSVGEDQMGYYFTAAYEVLQFLSPGKNASLLPFVQYEKLNTQETVPSEFSIDPSKEKTNITFGVMYKPHSHIGFKVDFINRDNEAGTGLDQFNAAVTYLF